MAAALAQRELEYEAARKLGAKQFQSETRVAEALAQLEAARAALLGLRLDLAHTAIAAPFKGVVERRMVEVGDYRRGRRPGGRGDRAGPVPGRGRRAGDDGRPRFEVGEPGVAAAGRRPDRPGPYPLRRDPGRRGHPDLPGRARGAPTPTGRLPRRDERPDRRARAGDRGASRLGGDPGAGRRRRRSASRRSTPDGTVRFYPGTDRQGRDRRGVAGRPARAAAA